MPRVYVPGFIGFIRKFIFFLIPNADVLGIIRKKIFFRIDLIINFDIFPPPCFNYLSNQRS